MVTYLPHGSWSSSFLSECRPRTQGDFFTSIFTKTSDKYPEIRCHRADVGQCSEEVRPDSGVSNAESNVLTVLTVSRWNFPELFSASSVLESTEYLSHITDIYSDGIRL
ncbi:unnamed protein product [Nesidiocoris tenuis]|uniref:Uncharacterized protein n=1 Tax=Nesidiocoris tenuis TaxID=355587 RepID=A0A6H5HMX8_9HEMI|nr:unnamed protein product [Nesidiocoris tenuis]CAB0019227.1 unnamed protein product [Nesidiocoris tenuis]